MAYKIGKLTDFNPEKRYTQEEMDSLGEIYIIIDGDLPDGYSDITNILNWIKIGDFLGMDYKFIRSRLQSFGSVPDEIWETYTNKEKFEICARKATSTLLRRLEVLGDSFNYWMAEFDDRSRDCRKTRMQYVKSILLRNVQPLWVFRINAILERDRLDSQYEIKGIEQLVVGNTDLVESLFNFIEATPLQYYSDNLGNLSYLGVHDDNGIIKDILGSPVGKYENSGMAIMQFEFLPEATITDKDELIQTIMKCLRDGIYE